MNRIRAWLQGIREGFDQPWDITIGITYDDDPSGPNSAAYDRGLTIGCWVGQLIKEDPDEVRPRKESLVRRVVRLTHP